MLSSASEYSFEIRTSCVSTVIFHVASLVQRLFSEAKVQGYKIITSTLPRSPFSFFFRRHIYSFAILLKQTPSPTFNGHESLPSTLMLLCQAHGTLGKDILAWSRGYKTFFMLNSTEHEIFPAHKC